MKSFLIGLGCLAAAQVFATQAQAVTITFDDLASGAEVTNQYAGVTFSSQAGSRILTTAQDFDTSLPNFICSGTGSINCVDDVYLDFDFGVSGLSFLAVGDNNVGDVGDVRVFSGLSLLGTVDLIMDGNPSGAPHLIDLGAFTNVTRIEIVDMIDAAGLGYDDFTFTPGDTVVPEPSTWAMLILGFGLAGGVLRRRQFALA